jgi:hypothetical protein
MNYFTLDGGLLLFRSIDLFEGKIAIWPVDLRFEA